LRRCVDLGAIGEDPNALPYPPSDWPQVRFWQFANRHDPYLAVRYAGETEAARLAEARRDVERIGRETILAQEPMQLYLDTNSAQMTVWPPAGIQRVKSAKSLSGLAHKACRDAFEDALRGAVGELVDRIEMLGRCGALKEQRMFAAKPLEHISAVSEGKFRKA
jgi:hypothetical protein